MSIFEGEGGAGEKILFGSELETMNRYGSDFKSRSHALIHTQLYRVFYSKWDLYLQTEHHAVLNKTLN